MKEQGQQSDPCTVCLGRGEVEGGHDIAPKMRHPEPDYWVKCARCNGTGKASPTDQEHTAL